MELSKKDKKIAREIIEKGLQTEYAKGLNSFDGILQHWKNKTIENREAYQKLYDQVRKYDKHIARRYDGMTGSKYLLVIAGQLADGIIKDDDLENFPDEVKQTVKLWASGF